MNIHFICRGNVLRSLIAETYLKSLGIKGITTVSSGTNVNWSDTQERKYFANTLLVLGRHKILPYVKSNAEQLTQKRLDDCGDVIVVMNQRVIDEAIQIVKMPDSIYNWEIIDIGEGSRTNRDNRESYEEEIYQEITNKVDELILTL